MEELKGKKGTEDQFSIDKMLFQEVKWSKKNLAMEWISYRKAYDMVPHSWVTESLNVMCIAKNVLNVFGKMMKSWRVELSCGAETLGEVTIKRVIFQGDALLLLLFVIAMIPLTHILQAANLGMNFELERG